MRPGRAPGRIRRRQPGREERSVWVNRRKPALPIGVLATALLVGLATIGIVNGLWSKNLVILGTVETGDLNADWTTSSGSDGQGSLDPCSNPWNPIDCDSFPHKDVGQLDCLIDDEDQQIVHFVVRNAYPSYEADCEVHFTNTGTIPWNVIGFAIDPAEGLTNCIIEAQGGQSLTVACDQMTIKYVDNVGVQFDPGDEGASSFIIHVEQAAAQGTCTGTGFGTASWTTTCTERASYAVDLKACVAQWNETATFQQCVESPQHEGPGFNDNGGSPPFVVQAN
jgi:hypothetical protein